MDRMIDAPRSAPPLDERPKTRRLTAARIMRDPMIDRPHATVLGEVLADLAEQAEALSATAAGKPTARTRAIDGTTYVDAVVEVTIPRDADGA